MLLISASGFMVPTFKHTNGVEFREFVQWFTFHVNLFQVVEASSEGVTPSEQASGDEVTSMNENVFLWMS